MIDFIVEIPFTESNTKKMIENGLKSELLTSLHDVKIHIGEDEYKLEEISFLKFRIYYNSATQIIEDYINCKTK